MVSRVRISGRLRRSWGTLLLLLWMGLPAAAAPAGLDLGLLEAKNLRATAADWVVLDARPLRRWREGHLPGALSFSWREHTGTDAAGVSHRVHPPEQLAVDLGRLGIDETTAVAVYGDADTSWGGEGWVCWVLAWLGHRGPVRLLAGGIQSWRALEFPLTRDTTPPGEAAVYRLQLRPDLLRTVEQVVRDVGGAKTLVDTRTSWEWHSGRLPGAVHLSWKDLYTGPERRPLGREAYRSLLTERGIDPARSLVFYCTGGVRSAYAWTVHRLSGGGPAANFEGGTEGWRRRTQ